MSYVAQHNDTIPVSGPASLVVMAVGVRICHLHAKAIPCESITWRARTCSGLWGGSGARRSRGEPSRHALLHACIIIITTASLPVDDSSSVRATCPLGGD